MSKLNWRKAQLGSKPVRSIADENEWRGKDAAARWLDRKAKKPAKRRQSTREGAAL